MLKSSKLIVCIVQRGKADKIVKAAMDAGAAGATTFYARGTGVRQTMGLIGSFLSPEKEVIMIGVKNDELKPIYQAVIEAGDLRSKGKGFAFVQQIEHVVGFVEE